MGGELRTFNAYLHVVDTQHLPEGVTPDTVAESFRTALRTAADAWATEHTDWLDLEPEVL